MGFIQPTDWDFNNGGVILFDDGVVWSYEAESPAFGDQGAQANEWPQYGFGISEWKPSTNMWERLTPNAWASPTEDHPPGYPSWPTEDLVLASPNYPPGTWTLADTTGPLNVAQIGAGSRAWIHVQDPDNHDDVWLYCMDYDADLGPIKIDRHARTWTRYMTNYASEKLWDEIASNIAIWGEYMWFLTMPDVTCAGEAVALVRAEKSNPDNCVIVHTWVEGHYQSYHDTSTLDLPSWFEEGNYLQRTTYSLAISDDGYAYLGCPTFNIFDSRTTGIDTYHMDVGILLGFKIGDYDLEVVYWNSNQGWVGSGLNYYWGTAGIETLPGEFDSRRYSEPNGMGFKPLNGGYTPVIRDGWYYWIDNSGHWGGAYGTSRYLCRMDLSKLRPLSRLSEPIQHNPQDPLFEIIGNTTNPWEGNAGHLTRYGNFIFWRDGGTPILPHENLTLTFDDEGNIIYKCNTFPPYYSAGGIRELPPHQTTRALLKLGVPNLGVADVTVTFTGTSLTGYGNIREVPTSQPELIVKLGDVSEGPDV